MSEDKERGLGDVFKKIVSTGLGAAFMTEEAIRERLGDLSVSKDVLNNILANAKTTRSEFVSAIKNEIKSYLGGVDITKEIDKVVEKYDIEVNATFKFKPKKNSKSSKKKSE